ncbi:LacI family DNA-binding transcriptional regulator [Microlunatus ginsengisoli]|jgi:LacI family transcriptional regulator|uniref:LacI family DNA-binding transcriptional regulator n=1 Tax=Microlunatus ginsengisoli TaxID=363863 RepID=A0ABP6ZKW1_9ACTN
MPGDADAEEPRPVTIYDVAREAGVAASTVSRALSRPGRVSFRTAERIRRVASELGYHTEPTQRAMSETPARLLAMVVADITNPVFHGMIRGAERTAQHAGYQLVLVESQESAGSERAALDRLAPVVDGVVLASSRMTDGQIRAVAKEVPLVVLNRLVDQVPSVAGDDLGAARQLAELLAGHGHRRIAYLAGPEASWADGMRWRGLLEAGHELDLIVRRIGPSPPTPAGGAQAADAWLQQRSTAVIAYNDLLAIGFMRAVLAAGVRIPADVSVVGFDNIRDAELIEPHLTTVASPLVSLGSAAVNHLLKTRRDGPGHEPVLLPARLVSRDTVGPPGGDHGNSRQLFPAGPGPRRG